jgi:hypothetical protein
MGALIWFSSKHDNKAALSVMLAQLFSWSDANPIFSFIKNHRIINVFATTAQLLLEFDVFLNLLLFSSRY